MPVLFTKALNGRSVAVVFVVVLVAFLNQVVKANGCADDLDCPGTKDCCKQRYSWQTNVCKSNCIDESCSDDDDCGTSECCNSLNKCSWFCSTDYSSTIVAGLATWIIIVIVVSIIVVVVIPVTIVVICCCCCGAAARQPRQGIILQQQPASAGGTTVVALNSQNTQQQQSAPQYAPQPIEAGYSNYAAQPTNQFGSPPPYKT